MHTLFSRGNQFLMFISQLSKEVIILHNLVSSKRIILHTLWGNQEIKYIFYLQSKFFLVIQQKESLL